MHTVRELPVVPICRRGLILIFRIQLDAAPNQRHLLARPASTRGAFRDRHERWARDAMDAICHETNDLSRTAKSCGPGAPTLALSERSDPLMTVAKEPGHRGERV